MKRLKDNIIKNISKQDINIKKNYKLFRFLEKVLSFDVLNKNKYEDIFAQLEDRKIKLRVFNASSKKNGIIIFIHGGGWVLGSIESYTNICKEISQNTNRMVISIDYRLAPEYPYPAGFNDCYEVVNLIMNHLNLIDLNDKNVCLMGDSAGANLVAAISLKSRKTKDFKIYKQILLYPALQSDYSNKTKYKSVITKGKDYFLTQNKLQEYISLYIKNSKYLKDYYAFPLNKKMLFFQPQTLLITSDNDPLRDEGRKYARRLKLCFNKVKYYNFEGAMHGFLTQIIGKKYKNKAFEKIIEFLGDKNEETK